ncbi:MAG TPA: hypothetical protein VFQ86_05920 [Arachidicoccus soli]|nr:hypothetical protein [Arachidicoccus soli]
MTPRCRISGNKKTGNIMISTDRIATLIKNAIEYMVTETLHPPLAESLPSILYDELVTLLEKADEGKQKGFAYSPLSGMKVVRSENFQVFYNDEFLSPCNKYY